jgi:hypothetical protein
MVRLLLRRPGGVWNHGELAFPLVVRLRHGT